MARHCIVKLQKKYKNSFFLSSTNCTTLEKHILRLVQEQKEQIHLKRIEFTPRLSTNVKK